MDCGLTQKNTQEIAQITSKKQILIFCHVILKPATDTPKADFFSSLKVIETCAENSTKNDEITGKCKTK